MPALRFHRADLESLQLRITNRSWRRWSRTNVRVAWSLWERRKGGVKTLLEMMEDSDRLRRMGGRVRTLVEERYLRDRIVGLYALMKTCGLPNDEAG